VKCSRRLPTGGHPLAPTEWPPISANDMVRMCRAQRFRSPASSASRKKRSPESEDYASKVRATPLSWLRRRVWVGDVQLACCAFRSMAAFSPRRRNNPEARPARPQRRGPSRRDTAPTDRPAMGRHRGPDWPPADCWHRCGRGTQSRRRSRKTRRGCRAWWRSRAPAGSRQVFCNSNTGLTAAFQDGSASRRSIQRETCGTCSRDMFEPFR
jgi:hypothetical protein